MTYLDTNETDDEEYLREVKTKNRDLAIGAVLDDEVEEYKNRNQISTWDQSDPNAKMGVMYISVRSINVSGSKFISLDELYDKVISHLNLITNHKYPAQKHTTMSSLDITLQNNNSLSQKENSDANVRRILSRILMLSGNIIPMASRQGPANSVVLGTEASELLNDSPPNQIANLTITVSDKINPRKVIVLRTSTNSTDVGLNVINNTNSQYYYIQEIPSFSKTIAWFEII